jgi:hypothetical protein
VQACFTVPQNSGTVMHRYCSGIGKIARLFQVSADQLMMDELELDEIMGCHTNGDGTPPYCFCL